jgi:hypothetical protein
MGFWANWQTSRARRQRVEVYCNHLLREPDPAVLQWLAAASGSTKAARRELAFARRAIGLIVAERDALDDRTAADVAHHLAPVVAAEARRDADVGRLWSDRWRAYTGALAVRGHSELPAVRLARVLLAGAGMSAPAEDDLRRGTAFVQDTRASLNEQLRTAFGAASLPEDVRPSALRG